MATASKQNLQVKEDTNEKNFYVEDLTELYVSSEDEVLRLMKIGNKNKRIAYTSKYYYPKFRNDKSKK